MSAKGDMQILPADSLGPFRRYSQHHKQTRSLVTNEAL